MYVAGNMTKCPLMRSVHIWEVSVSGGLTVCTIPYFCGLLGSGNYWAFPWWLQWCSDLAGPGNLLHGLHWGVGTVQWEPAHSSGYWHIQRRAHAEVWHAEMAGTVRVCLHTVFTQINATLFKGAFNHDGTFYFGIGKAMFITVTNWHFYYSA